MDKYQDIENVKAETKIPLSLAPQPALPNHFPKKLSERPPLNTLAGPNGLNHNVPSLNLSPHQEGGRELQCLTPLGNRKKVTVKRRVNFDLPDPERMQSPDLLQKSYMASMDRQYTGEILSYLLQAETRVVALPRVKSETRACVINWLMKINGLDGNPATIQTAVWFLDAVLATLKVTLENMQLVAAAAYLIASKLHGPPTSTSKLVEYANRAFTKQSLVEAEKNILFKLKFPRLPVVPQDYLCYFARWWNKERPGEIEAASTFICLWGMMVNTTLCSEYPSVVAAASITNALMLLKKKDLIPRLQTCPAFVAAEKKAGNISHTCAILQNAVRLVAAKNYSYTFLVEQYRMPENIAQAILSAAKDRN